MYDDNIRSETAKLFADLSKKLKKCMRKSFEGVGLTMPQTAVMHTITKYGEMKVSDISEKVALSNSTVSGIIDRLEKQGLVVKTRNEKDRRAVYVKATEKYEEIHKELHEKVETGFEDMLGLATPEELEKIMVGLTTLRDVLYKK